MGTEPRWRRMPLTSVRGGGHKAEAVKSSRLSFIIFEKNSNLRKNHQKNNERDGILKRFRAGPEGL